MLCSELVYSLRAVARLAQVVGCEGRAQRGCSGSSPDTTVEGLLPHFCGLSFDQMFLSI